MYDELHYKPAQLAKLWGFHPDKVREWFQNEPGVLIEDHPEKLHKRGYKSMRIPASVAARVYDRHISK
jgi:hypothetical protein